MLRRFKKFFLYRYRLLKIKTEGGPKPEFYEDFKNRFLNKVTNLNGWFDQNEEDIFQSEYRLLIQMETSTNAQKICDAIVDFEQKAMVSGGINDNTRYPYLYYSKDVNCSIKIKSLSNDCYASVTRWAKENFTGFRNLGQNNQFKKFTTFLGVNDTVKENKDEQTIVYKSLLDKGYEEREYIVSLLKTHLSFSVEY